MHSFEVYDNQLLHIYAHTRARAHAHRHGGEIERYWNFEACNFGPVHMRPRPKAFVLSPIFLSARPQHCRPVHGTNLFQAWFEPNELLFTNVSVLLHLLLGSAFGNGIRAHSAPLCAFAGKCFQLKRHNSEWQLLHSIMFLLYYV